jgi:hypothetical protein
LESCSQSLADCNADIDLYGNAQPNSNSYSECYTFSLSIGYSNLTHFGTLVIEGQIGITGKRISGTYSYDPTDGHSEDQFSGYVELVSN